jgi:uncharacterized membrane protein SirB2
MSMVDRKLIPTIRDSLTTIGAVWLAMAIAAFLAELASSSLGGQLASLLAYICLVAAYMRWTGPGRRSSLPYFLAGLFPPLICFVLLTPLLPHLEPSFFENGGMLVFVGIGVGIQSGGGGPDASLEAYLPLMWLNLLLPIALLIGGRAFLRYRRD